MAVEDVVGKMGEVMASLQIAREMRASPFRSVLTRLHPRRARRSGGCSACSWSCADAWPSSYRRQDGFRHRGRLAHRGPALPADDARQARALPRRLPPSLGPLSRHARRLLPAPPPRAPDPRLLGQACASRPRGGARRRRPRRLGRGPERRRPERGHVDQRRRHHGLAPRRRQGRREGQGRRHVLARRVRQRGRPRLGRLPPLFDLPSPVDRRPAHHASVHAPPHVPLPAPRPLDLRHLVRPDGANRPSLVRLDLAPPVDVRLDPRLRARVTPPLQGARRARALDAPSRRRYRRRHVVGGGAARAERPGRPPRRPRRVRHALGDVQLAVAPLQRPSGRAVGGQAPHGVVVRRRQGGGRRRRPRRHPSVVPGRRDGVQGDGADRVAH